MMIKLFKTFLQGCGLNIFTVIFLTFLLHSYLDMLEGEIFLQNLPSIVAAHVLGMIMDF